MYMYIYMYVSQVTLTQTGVVTNIVVPEIVKNHKLLAHEMYQVFD